MILDNHIEKTEDSLLMLDESLPQASVDRFVYGLQQRKWSDWDIVQFTCTIRQSHSFAMMENVRLKQWGRTFNEEYATDHNQYFSTAERSMNRIHSTLSGIRKAVTKLCYTSRKQLPADTDTPTVFERSPLLRGGYSPDLFGLEVYNPNVSTLYKELVDYLRIAEENVALCIEVIDRENYIRQHPEECLEVHDKCYDITLNHSRTIVQRFKDANVNIDNDIMKAIIEADDTQKRITELFHMLNVSEWNDYVICRAIREARSLGLTPEELQLWGKENVAQVMRVRKLIDHLGELTMEKIKRNSALSGYFVMRLLNWCQIKDRSKHSQLLDYITKRYSGMVVKFGAVKAEKRKLVFISNEENDKKQKDFNHLIDSFLSRF